MTTDPTDSAGEETQQVADVTVDERPEDHVPSRALVTNDDGVESPGLFALARAVRTAGLEPIVVAPDRNMSGAGTGIGSIDQGEGIPYRRMDRDDITTYALPGPPGLAVLTASLGAFGGLPGLVVSGINAGMNTGHSVIHSGTVGAVLTGRTFGCAGLAMSLAPSEPSEPWRWDTAEHVAATMVRWLHDLRRPDVVLNVNVPALDIDEIRGFRWARLASFGYFRVASTDGAGQRVEFGITGSEDDRSPDSDHALLAQGFVTVTALSTVDELAPVEVGLPEG